MIIKDIARTSSRAVVVGGAGGTVIVGGAGDTYVGMGSNLGGTYIGMGGDIGIEGGDGLGVKVGTCIRGTLLVSSILYILVLSIEKKSFVFNWLPVDDDRFPLKIACMDITLGSYNRLVLHLCICRRG